MPLYEYRCANDHLSEHFRPYRLADSPVTCACGLESFRIISVPAIIADDVPGGFVIENLDSVPRRFDSKSAYRDELKARGLTNDGFHHVGNPGEGSDKGVLVVDPNTGKRQLRSQRFISSQLVTEEDRVRQWHEDEARLQAELAASPPRQKDPTWFDKVWLDRLDQPTDDEVAREAFNTQVAEAIRAGKN